MAYKRPEGFEMKANTTPLPAAQIALLGAMADAIRKGTPAHYAQPPKGRK